MYEALHQRSISIEIIAREKQYFLWYQHKKNKFFHSNHIWRGCSFLIYGVITESRLENVQNGLTDRMVQQRHVGWFLVFPVCGVGLNLLVSGHFSDPDTIYSASASIRLLFQTLLPFTTCMLLFQTLIPFTACTLLSGYCFRPWYRLQRVLVSGYCFRPCYHLLRVC
jgi:hypothetical protein